MTQPFSDWVDVCRALDIVPDTPADSFEIFQRVLREDSIRHERVAAMRENPQPSIAELILRMTPEARQALSERVMTAHIDLRGARFTA